MTITTQSFNPVNIGAAPNDGQGDDLRTAFYKVDSNFSNISTIGFNSGNINAVGYTIQAGYFIGDGSQLSNVGGGGGGPSAYSNVNVAAYLGSNANISIINSGSINSYGTIYANAGTFSYSTGTGALVVQGGAGISGTLTVGNIVVLGNLNTVNTTAVTVANSFIFLANNNVNNILDIGFTGRYNVGQGNVYTGLAYHAYDGIYRLFSNVGTPPSNVVDFTTAQYPALIVGNILSTGNITGTLNVGNQPYITQIGNIAGSLNAVGNITTAYYFIGNGSQLTGLPATYTNAQVAAYLPTYTGNIGASNVYVAGNVTAVYGNLANDLYVQNIIASGNITLPGNLNAQNSVLATFFYGNGSQLTGLPQGYGNVNTQAFLQTYGGALNAGNTQVKSLTSNNTVTATGNIITANYFVGNGAFITGLPASYSNANVQTFLTAYTGTLFASNVYSSGNITALNFNGAHFGTGNFTAMSATGTIYANSGVQATSVGTGAIVVTGGMGVSGNLYVGNLTVLGTTTTVNTSALNVANSFVFLANNNISNATDIGFVGQYNAGQGNVFTGLAYHAADGIYRLFSNLTPAPSVTVNLANSYSANIIVGNIIAGNIVGTLIAPIQNYITSVGNLVSLASSGNITTTAYFVGNAAFLTGLPATYSNVNVSSFLANIGSNSIVTTGTVTASNFFYGNGLPVYNNSSTVYNGIQTATTNATLVDTVVLAGNTSVKWNVTSIDNINNRYKTSEINALTDGANVYHTEYSVLKSNNSFNIATFVSNVTLGNINLWAIGDSSNVSVAYQRVILGNATVNGYLPIGPAGPTGPQGPAGQVNYSNVNVTAYLAGTVTTGNLTVTGNISAGTTLLIGTANVLISNTAQSNSTTSGALVVTGGVGVGGNLYVANTIIAGNISTTYFVGNAAGGGTGTTSAISIGYLGVPQNSVGSSNYVFTTFDQGKHIYSTTSSSANLYIATAASASWAIGTAISIVNGGAGNVNITANTGVTLYLAGNTITGSNIRILGSKGMATLLYVDTNIWYINGSSLT
jgi:hypothetical protein